MQTLTPKQKKLYDIYRDPSNWRPPTFKRLAELYGVKNRQTIKEMLDMIKRKVVVITSLNSNTSMDDEQKVPADEGEDKPEEEGAQTEPEKEDEEDEDDE